LRPAQTKACTIALFTAGFLLEDLSLVAAGLVGNGAGRLAGALTTGLAFAAARIRTPPDVGCDGGFDVFHRHSSVMVSCLSLLYNNRRDCASRFAAFGKAKDTGLTFYNYIMIFIITFSLN
jgi:hypothetical protein